jgi:hypothetical protein
MGLVSQEGGRERGRQRFLCAGELELSERSEKRESNFGRKFNICNAFRD